MDNFNLLSKNIPYGHRNLKVIAKATGYTDSQPSNVVVYYSRPHLQFKDSSTFTITNCRAAATSYEVYQGETLVGTVEHGGTDGGTLDVSTANLTLTEGLCLLTVKGIGTGVEDNQSKMLPCTYTTDGGIVAPDSTLANNDTALIFAAAKSGLASNYWSVGDEIDIPINGTDYTFVILGFNHDEKADGSGKAGITFGMKNLYASYYVMNSSSTNSGGWESCSLRTTLNSTFYGYLPEAWQNAIVQVSKIAGTGGGTSSGYQTSTDKLFLLSEREVFSSRSYSVTDEFNAHSQYAYYRDIANTSALRVKTTSNGTGSANYWWLRSPRSGYSSSFCYVNSSGNADSTYASASCGLSFGFCI